MESTHTSPTGLEYVPGPFYTPVGDFKSIVDISVNVEYEVRIQPS